ncbi:MAG: sigma-70 family RNA polymerase sigma factor [Zavarzinella sp.]
MKQSIQHLVQQIRTPASTDQALLERLRSNDQVAFQELVHRYSRLVWAVCRSQLACEADAEDAYQSAFLVLYQRHTSIRKPEQIGSWLYQVAFRICARIRRAQNRRQHHEHGAARAEGSEVVANQLWDETLQQVYEIVSGMPETYRTAFVLCCLEGKGLTEAAEQLGWKLGTLSGRLSRAKAKVVRELQSKGLCLPVLATIGLATPAAALPARTAEMLIHQMNIPANISQFAQGAFTMYSTGKMALACIIATTLVLTVGNRWLTQSAAQQPTVQEKEIVQEKPSKILPKEEQNDYPFRLLDFYKVNGKALPEVFRPNIEASRLRGGEISKPGRYELREGTLIELKYTHMIFSNNATPYVKELEVTTEKKGIVMLSPHGIRAVDYENASQFERGLLELKKIDALPAPNLNPRNQFKYEREVQFYFEATKVGEEKVTITINKQPHEYTFVVVPDPRKSYVLLKTIDPKDASLLERIFQTALIPHHFVGEKEYQVMVPAEMREKAIEVLKKDTRNSKPKD